MEKPLIECFVDKKIPYVIAVNKSEDLTEKEKEQILALFTGEKNLLFVSAEKKEHIYELKEMTGIK